MIVPSLAIFTDLPLGVEGADVGLMGEEIFLGGDLARIAAGVECVSWICAMRCDSRVERGVSEELDACVAIVVEVGANVEETLGEALLFLDSSASFWDNLVGIRAGDVRVVVLVVVVVVVVDRLCVSGSWFSFLR